MSTAVLRDQRLTPSARALAGLIVAVAGKADHVDLTRGYLSSRLGVSERTMARLLAQLDVINAAGIITTSHSRDAARSAGAHDPTADQSTSEPMAAQGTAVRFRFAPFPSPPPGHHTGAEYL